MVENLGKWSLHGHLQSLFCQFTPRLFLEFCSHPDTAHDSKEFCWGFFWQRESFVFSTVYWWAWLWSTPEVWSSDPEEFRCLSKPALNWLHHSLASLQAEKGWTQSGVAEGGKTWPRKFFSKVKSEYLSGSHFLPPTLKFLREGSWCQPDPFRLPSVL